MIISHSDESNVAASELVFRYLPAIKDACQSMPALDLACGKGRNGLHLIDHGVPVIFADRSHDALAQVQARLEALPSAGNVGKGRTWGVDLEILDSAPLDTMSYGAILVFRYLHRPLLNNLRDALIPGGLLIYETYTIDQAKLGRPNNPDFLLRKGELVEVFGDWEVLHKFEGIERDVNNGNTRAIAQIVVRKPL